MILVCRQYQNYLTRFYIRFLGFLGNCFNNFRCLALDAVNFKHIDYRDGLVSFGCKVAL